MITICRKLQQQQHKTMCGYYLTSLAPGSDGVPGLLYVLHARGRGLVKGAHYHLIKGVTRRQASELPDWCRRRQRTGGENV